MKENQVVKNFSHLSTLNGWRWENTRPILRSDSNLLFQISGGAVFEKELSGINQSPYIRIASFQNCLRTDTWDKIGYSGRHHLLFGMIGHFMFFEDDEFSTKQIMIKTALEFLNDYLGISLDNLAVSVHPNDNVSFEIWKSLKINDIRFNPNNVSVDPFNQRYGTRTEIIFLGQLGSECELWNIVFHSNSYKESERKNSKITADSGASIDRLIRARDHKNNDYETDYWIEFVSLIDGDLVTKMRLAEMLKASTFLLNENLNPGNKGASYVLRKIIRESYNLSNSKEQCLSNFIATENYWFNNHNSKMDDFRLELDTYQLALGKGEKELIKIINKKGKLEEKDILFLFDSFGYPKSLAIKKVKEYEK